MKTLTAHDVWDAWQAGMRAQGRISEMIPERLKWSTLSKRDKLLDEYIAARLMYEILGTGNEEARLRAVNAWNAIWDGSG